MRSLQKKGVIIALSISAIVFPVMTAMAVTSVPGMPYSVEDSGWAKPNGTPWPIGNSYSIGTAWFTLKDTVHTYEQVDCPANFTTTSAAITTTDYANGGAVNFREDQPVMLITGAPVNDTVNRNLNVYLKKITTTTQRLKPGSTTEQEVVANIMKRALKFITFKTVSSEEERYPHFPPFIGTTITNQTTSDGWEADTPVVICTQNLVSSSSSSSSSLSSSSWSSSSYSSSLSSSSTWSSSSFSSASYCGDMICNGTENSMSCPNDCGYSYSSSSSIYSSSAASSSSSYSSMY